MKLKSPSLSRRQFVRATGLAVSGLGLGLLCERNYRFKAHLTIPPGKDFSSAASRWENSDALLRFNDQMIREGDLLSVKYSRQGDQHQWTYLFRSESAYQRWTNTLQAEKIFNLRDIPPEFQYRFEEGPV